MNTQELLEKALDLISAPGTWCKDYAAIDKHGTPVAPNDKSAVAWCAYGALEHVIAGRPIIVRDAWSALDTAAEVLLHQEGALGDLSCYVSYNNSHTQEDVKIMFKQAIADLSEDGRYI